MVSLSEVRILVKKILRNICIILNQKYKIRFIVSRILMKANLSRFIIFSRNGYKIRFHPSALTAGLWINPNERKKEEKFLCSLVKKGDCVIDVGANIGTISLALNSVIGESGRIYAFEPHPRIYSYFIDNIALNGCENSIEAFCMGLGENEKTLFFSDQSDDSNNSISENGDIQVSVSALDNVIFEQRISLLKIDVVGYEYQMLQGAKNTCLNVDIIYLECIAEMLTPNDADEEKICNFLTNFGFQIYQVIGDTLVDNIIGSHKKKMILAKKIK